MNNHSYIDFFFQIIYPFTHNQSFITIATPGLDPYHSAVMGNLLNPAYVSSLTESYPHPFSFVDKIKNIVENIMVPFIWLHYINKPAENEVSIGFAGIYLMEI